jgi:hypothetical protein
VALVVVSAGAAVAVVTAASNRRAARTDARRLLSMVSLPAGAVGARSDPAVHGLLNSASESMAGTALVDRHRFWRVSGDPSTVLSWVQAHRPRGSTTTGTSSSSGPTGDSEGVAFSFPANAKVILSELLVVSVARARGGGTAVRADAQVAWVRPRLSTERVPAGVSVITVTDTRLNPHTGKSSTSTPIVVTDAGNVQRITALVDALPLDQLGLVPCPVDFGPDLDIKFYAQQGGPVLAEAVADGSGCGIVSFSVGGKSEPALTGGPGLIQQLEKLLGTTF